MSTYTQRVNALTNTFRDQIRPFALPNHETEILANSLTWLVLRFDRERYTRESVGNFLLCRVRIVVDNIWYWGLLLSYDHEDLPEYKRVIVGDPVKNKNDAMEGFRDRVDQLLEDELKESPGIVAGSNRARSNGTA